jgi:hypothetical protein
MDASLTTLSESDIAKHLNAAQSLVTRCVVSETSDGKSSTALAGTRRRFVSTVSTSNLKKAREVELIAAISNVKADDQMLSIPQHSLIYKVRRGIAVALAIGDVFGRQTALEDLSQKNAASPLGGSDAENFQSLQQSASFVTSFAFIAYLKQMIETEGEAANDIEEANFNFDTAHDGLKSILAGLQDAIDGVKDDKMLTAHVHQYAERCLEGLMERKSRFEHLSAFENTHISLDSDGFTLIGFEATGAGKSKPLVMNFKKPNEIIGNHIAKYQAMKLSKMIMAYDFDRQLNPFVDLGGFLFTFIGDGAPGTGKTILIQMIAGMINDYCQVAGYQFHYENFGVDQISSYQGKSGQNCKSFVNNVMSTRSIGFGTIDDIDQVAAKRSDDKASAGQQEVTAVLMESFAGASTVVRGNCSFGMFSNYPENVDDALRQRAGARWLVDGPQTADDYIDIFALLVGKNHEIPLGDHDLYAAQAIQQAVDNAYADYSKPQEEGLMRIYDRFLNDVGEPKTLRDVGLYLHKIKEVEARFTGRAIKNITDAIKMRAMDIELPDEWFETPEAFMHKPYDEKKAMIEEMRQPFTMDMVMQEINRYADSEFRYTDKSDSAAVENVIRNERVRERAIREIEAMKQSGKWAEGK